MGDEYSDILGGDTLPIRRNTGAGQWSGLSITIKSTFTLSLLLVAYVLLSRAWEHVLKWREKSYKLALRRRHGIPDNDHRPFNVAYAAVQRAREHREKENARIRRADRVAASSQQPPQERTRYRPGSQRNADISRPNLPAGGLPGRFYSSSMDSYAPSTSSNDFTHPAHSNSNRVTFADGYNTSASPLDTHAELAGPSKRSARKSLGILKVSDDRKKRERGLDEYDENGDIAKKTRVEGDEFIDGDEEAVWQDSHLSQSATRGPKRGLIDEEDSDDVSSKREKRPRKVSADKSAPMVVDDEGEDQLSDLRSISRGKKRDRAEAGSTFGGEEEEEEEREVDSNEKSRRRKRRNKRRSDAGASSRGRKRDRDTDDETGESDDSTSVQIARKKRGKNKHREEEEKLSDISMEDSSIVSSKGKKIGEEWTSNGVRYKIGPNGQRLRLELIKKARQKFVMPLDSVHPDRKANMEVYVEAWLTEEEYRDAKAQQLLSWQDSPKASTEPETPPITTPKSTSPPARTGKHLLWESTSTPPITRQDNPFENPSKPPTSQDALRRSIATNVGLNLNPFPSRRIASAVRVPTNSGTPSSPGLSDSTNSLSSPRTYRQYSKWEKQDLEAKAMMRMRESNRQKEEEKEKREREEREKKEKERQALAPPPSQSTIPKIVLTQASEEKVGATKPAGFSFPGVSSTPTAGAGESKAEQPKPPTSSTPAFSFAKPAAPSSASTGAPTSASASSASPFSNPFSFAPSTANSQDKSKPSLGLGMPSTTPANSSTSAAATSSSGDATNNAAAPPKLNFGFPSKPTGSSEQSTSSSSNPLLSRMGGAATSTQSPASSSLAPPTFSFGPKPASTATASQPTAPSLSPFGAPQPQSQGQSTTGAAPVKFNFGVNNKPATSPPAAMSTGTPSSLSGALNSNAPSSESAPKPAFSFANPQSAESSASGTATTTPKFSFGTPSSSTPAPGNTSSTGNETAHKPGLGIFGVAASTAPKTDSGSTAPTSTMASPFGGGASSGNNIFGGGSNASKDASKNNNVFGSAATSSSPFGGAGAGSSGNTFGVRPALGFSSGSAQPSASPFGGNAGGMSSAGGAGTGTGNAFSFGTKPSQTGTSSTGAGPSGTGSGETKSAFGFGTGAGTSSSMAPAAANASSSPFGGFGGGMNAFGAAAKSAETSGQSKPSGFSFGSSAGATNGSASNAPKNGFAFGTPTAAPTTSGGAQTPSKSAFSFGNTNTTPAGTPGGSSGSAAPGFSFGGQSAGSGSGGASGGGGGGFFGLGGNPTSSNGAPAPVFGAPVGGSSPFGGFGSAGTSGSAFSFGNKPSGSEQQSK